MFLRHSRGVPRALWGQVPVHRIGSPDVLQRSEAGNSSARRVERWTTGDRGTPAGPHELRSLLHRGKDATSSCQFGNTAVELRVGVAHPVVHRFAKLGKLRADSRSEDAF